jgi:hypothetical protein
MTLEDFQTAFFENVSFPFEFSEVKNIEANCGSTWITLENGNSFFIIIEQCEYSQE